MPIAKNDVVRRDGFGENTAAIVGRYASVQKRKRKYRGKEEKSQLVLAFSKSLQISCYFPISPRLSAPFSHSLVPSRMPHSLALQSILLCHSVFFFSSQPKVLSPDFLLLRPSRFWMLFLGRRAKFRRPPQDYRRQPRRAFCSYDCALSLPNALYLSPASVHKCRPIEGEEDDIIPSLRNSTHKSENAECSKIRKITHIKGRHKERSFSLVRHFRSRPFLACTD